MISFDLLQQLARINANVVAIDPSKELIKAAHDHLKIYSSHDELTKRIDYRTETIEEHNAKNNTKYDAVIVSEVIEHIDDKEQFLQACTEPLSTGGSIFITTFNKTNIAWLSGIICAEYILNMIPRGTHDWNKFISPLDTQRQLEQCTTLNFKLQMRHTQTDYILFFLLDGCSTILCNGFVFEFWRNKWVWTKHQQFSYALQAIKS